MGPYRCCLRDGGYQPEQEVGTDLITAVHAHSLGLMIGQIFVGCRTAQSVAGCATYNEERIRALQDPLSWIGYIQSADFWSRRLQNWQSEFLAIGSVGSSRRLRASGGPE